MSIEGDLYRPLGLDRPKRRSKLSLPRASSLVLVLGAAGIVWGSTLTGLERNTDRRLVDILSKAPADPAPQMLETAALPKLPKAMPGVSGPTIISPGIGTGPVTFRVEDSQSLRQSPSLAHMPDNALVEDSESGPLPIRSADGRRPFDVYSGAWSGKPTTRIAIVVGGVGISQTGSMQAVERLPAGVTLGFSPAGNSLDRWMQEARRGGHELVLQVPLEPIGYPTVDPGANTVTASAATAGDFSALYASLGKMTNYVGVMNYMGARFTGDKAAMEPFIAELGRRGLMYLDDGSSARSLGKDTAYFAGVPAATANVLLDQNQDPAAIAGELDMLEKVARAQGSAIGVASAFEQSVGAIAAWIVAAQKRGIEIVPVSALAYDPEAR